MFCCPVFSLFHRRAFKFQPVRRKVCRTRRIVPRACRATWFGPQTQLRRSSSNCPNQVREVKVRPIKNEPSSPNFFFQIRRTSRTRFAKKKCAQLRPVLNIAWSGLAKYLRRLRQAFAKSFLGRRTPEVLLCKVAW